MRPRTIRKSKYKGVSLVKTYEGEKWLMSGMFNGLRFACKYDTELEAARNYDLMLIRHGKKPCNILTKKLAK